MSGPREPDHDRQTAVPEAYRYGDYRVATVGALSSPASATGMPVISTRGHYDTDSGELKSGYTKWEFETNGAVPGIDTACASDVTIFVHG